MPIVNSGARLDRLPLSRFHKKMLALIGAGAVVDAFDIYLAGGVVAAMTKEGFSTPVQNATFMSATFVGMFLGAILAGVIGDRFGRRASYQANLLIFGLASLAAFFAPNIQLLTGLRFLMGLGLGAELVVAAATLGEFVPAVHRGRWGAFLSMIVAAGLPLASWLGYFLIPTFGWRWMFVVAGIGAMIIWVLRKSMPESPRWLESVGRLEEAEATMRKIEAEVESRSGPLPPVRSVTDLNVPKAPLRELFNRKLLPRLGVASAIVMSISVTTYGFIAWLPTFFVSHGVTIVKSLGYTTTMTVGAVVGPLLATFVADRVSRIKSLVFSSAMVIVAGVVFSQLTSPEPIMAAGFVLVASAYFMASMGQFNFVPELFPTAYRLRGAGFASMMGRATAIGMPFVTVFMFGTFGLTGVIATVVFMLLVLIASVLALNVETSRESLENISNDIVPAAQDQRRGLETAKKLAA